MYSASCGGRTHSLQELGLPAYGYPYFAVECPYCRRNPERWVARLAESEATTVRKGERERITLARQLGWNVVPSNTFEMKWPPGSGKIRSFPEIDRACFFDLPDAKKKLKDTQWPLVERLIALRESTSGEN